MKKHGNKQSPKNLNKVLKKTVLFSNLDQKSMQTQNLKPRFFTGIQTTGTLGLSHYLGVIRHILTIQDSHEIIIMLADLHALTIPKPNFDYRQKSYEIASLLYACGLKEENCKIFIQSEISEHLELT